MLYIDAHAIYIHIQLPAAATNSTSDMHAPFNKHYRCTYFILFMLSSTPKPLHAATATTTAGDSVYDDGGNYTFAYYMIPGAPFSFLFLLRNAFIRSDKRKIRMQHAQAKRNAFVIISTRAATNGSICLKLSCVL